MIAEVYHQNSSIQGPDQVFSFPITTASATLQTYQFAFNVTQPTNHISIQLHLSNISGISQFGNVKLEQTAFVIKSDSNSITCPWPFISNPYPERTDLGVCALKCHATEGSSTETLTHVMMWINVASLVASVALAATWVLRYFYTKIVPLDSYILSMSICTFMVTKFFLFFLCLGLTFLSSIFSLLSDLDQCLSQTEWSTVVVMTMSLIQLQEVQFFVEPNYSCF